MEIEKLGHVHSKNNPADPLTKVSNLRALIEFLEKGTLTLPVERWVKHMNIIKALDFTDMDGVNASITITRN